MTLEDDLRDALHAHAEQVDPSADGLERIEARLAPVNARPRLAPRLLVAAAVLLVVGAVGTATFRNRDDGEIAALPSSSTTDPGAAPIENELPPVGDPIDDPEDLSESSSVTEATPSSADLPPAPDGILGPREATARDAVDRFLELIQRDGEEVFVTYEGSLARVSRTLENGDLGNVTALELGSVEMDDGSQGVVVTQALSPRVVIESPEPLTTSSGSSLALTGQGEGFEGTVNAQLFSSNDGVWLAQGFAPAGNFGVVASFSVELPVSGSGPAWLVVQSAGGTNSKLEPFSAVPVVIDAPLFGPDHLVTAISLDDPDGGLVVRSLPGADGDELGTLPPGQSGIRKRSALSAFVGDGEPNYGEAASLGEGEEWWNVWLPQPLGNGRQWGWVNSRYLAVGGEVADDELISIGEAFVNGLRGDDGAFAALPWSRRGVAVGLTSDVRRATAGQLADGAFWAATDAWILPSDYGGTTEGTGREIFSPTQSMLVEETEVGLASGPDPTTASPFGNDQALFATQFAGASYVQISDPTNDGSGWVMINIFVIQGTSGREIVGVVATPWVP